MTRYPRSGKGRKWTAIELKSVTAAWRGDTLTDGDGLVGEVRVATDGTISIRFKYAFRWDSKVAWQQCGTWPRTSLEAVRHERDRARELVRAGINPRDRKKVERIEAQAKVKAIIAEAEIQATERLTNRDMFEAWMKDGVMRADANAELRRLFEKDLMPHLGHRAVRDTTDSHLRDALRRVARNRECPGLAVMMLADLRQMYRWAEKRKPWRALLVEGDPSQLVDVKSVVPAGYKVGVRDRILDSEEIRELRSLFEKGEAIYEAAPDRRRATRPVQKQTQFAMWIALSTLCRIGELLKARWENVDLETGEWFVPAEDTKTKVEWLVFLSDFSLIQFKKLQEITGSSEWCFPSASGKAPLNAKTMAKQLGDRQIQFKERKDLRARCNDNSLVLAQGRNGAWTPHDLRRTGATVMQQLGITPDIIDRCQNHVLPGSKVRRHYLHYDFAKEKLDAWQALGKRLQAILEVRVVKHADTSKRHSEQNDRAPQRRRTSVRRALSLDASIDLQGKRSFESSSMATRSLSTLGTHR
jgi:integrase